MMEALNWVKLNKRWYNHLVLLVFKCLRNISPSYLCEQFDFVHNNHHHLTRNHTSNTLVVPKFKLNAGKRTFHVRAAYAWNNLRTNVIMNFDKMSMQQFKHKINET